MFGIRTSIWVALALLVFSTALLSLARNSFGWERSKQGGVARPESADSGQAARVLRSSAAKRIANESSTAALRTFDAASETVEHNELAERALRVEAARQIEHGGSDLETVLDLDTRRDTRKRSLAPAAGGFDAYARAPATARADPAPVRVEDASDEWEEDGSADADFEWEDHDGDPYSDDPLVDLLMRRRLGREPELANDPASRELLEAMAIEAAGQLDAGEELQMLKLGAAPKSASPALRRFMRRPVIPQP